MNCIEHLNGTDLWLLLRSTFSTIVEKNLWKAVLSAPTVAASVLMSLSTVASLLLLVALARLKRSRNTD